MSPTDIIIAQSNRGCERKEACACGVYAWPSYKEIAPKASLNHEKRGDDITTFEIRKARLPDRVFWDILQELRTTTHLHGLRDFQSNEKARSQYAFAHINRILSLFSGVLLDTPDIDLKDKIKPEWTEHRYAIGSIITLLIIEVESRTGFIDEQLGHLALVVTRCLAAISTNPRNDLQAHITVVLSDGNYFQFFRFSVGKFIKTCGFSMYKFTDGSQRIPIATGPSRWSSTDTFNTQETVLQIRAVCEALYTILLHAYSNGIVAHTFGESCDKEDEEVQQWRAAKSEASQAITKANIAWDQWHNLGECEDDSAESAGMALDFLNKSISLAPVRKHELLPGLTKEMAAK